MYFEYSKCSDVSLSKYCLTKHVLNMCSSYLLPALPLIEQCPTCDTTLYNL